MPEPKEGDRKVTECSECYEVTECLYEADPYASDIHGDHTLVWECDPCRHESAMDI